MILKVPEEMLKPLQDYLRASRYHYRPESDEEKSDVLTREYHELCEDFCWLNDNGVPLALYALVSSFSFVSWGGRYNGGSWEQFIQFLKTEYKSELKIIPATEKEIQRHE